MDRQNYAMKMPSSRYLDCSCCSCTCTHTYIDAVFPSHHIPALQHVQPLLLRSRWARNLSPVSEGVSKLYSNCRRSAIWRTGRDFGRIYKKPVGTIQNRCFFCVFRVVGQRLHYDHIEDIEQYLSWVVFCFFVELATLLVFPYFLESHLRAAIPSLWMMDYQASLR